MSRRSALAVCLLLPSGLALIFLSSSAASAASATRSKPDSLVTLAIPSSDYLKKDLVIRVPIGTIAKRVMDSPDTLVTFPDGSQMLAFPDAASLRDYRQGLPTTGAEKATFLVDSAQHFTFLDKSYSPSPPGISFYAKKDLPKLVKNKALATGLLCTNHGSSETKQTSSKATIDAMVAACLTATPSK